jgi:hypothetical protein
MDEFNQLDLIAEIAAAFLGFIALFLALSRSDGRFAESDRHFVQALVLSASLALVLAIAPRPISLFMTDSSIWPVAAGCAIFLGLLTSILQIRLQLRMSSDEAAKIHMLWHIFAWGFGVVASVFFISAVFYQEKAAAFFVAGVSTLVALSLTVFIGLVFRRFF